MQPQTWVLFRVILYGAEFFAGGSDGAADRGFIPHHVPLSPASARPPGLAPSAQPPSAG